MSLAIKPRNLALAAILCALPFSAHAQDPAHDRAMWFWQAPQSPFGSRAILGNPALEDATIARLKAWGVTTLYGSYAGDGATQQAALRAWNAKLAAHGIASYLLLSETEYIFPTSRETLDAHIHNGVLAFNTASAPPGRFTGLAFDVEPHTLTASTHAAGWKAAMPLERRAYLAGLLSMYQHIRTLIGPSTTLEVTLPSWYSHTTGTVGWANSADRDQYFTTLAATCDRFSIMAFELDSSTKVLARSEEQLAVLHGRARIALRANLGSEWPTLAAFWSAAHDVEASTHHGIEIQSYAILAADESPKP